VSFVLVRNQIWPTVNEPSRSVTVTDAVTPNTTTMTIATTKSARSNLKKLEAKPNRQLHIQRWCTRCSSIGQRSGSSKVMKQLANVTQTLQDVS
jgi:hypothetical protein